jgi:hypothetical protein
MAGFMTLQVWREDGVEVKRDGNEYMLPSSYADFDERTGITSDALWWAEYSASGYMDRTDPVSGKTAVEAARECWELYGSDEPEERRELASVLWQARKLDREAGK